MSHIFREVMARCYFYDLRTSLVAKRPSQTYRYRLLRELSVELINLRLYLNFQGTQTINMALEIITAQ